MLYEVITVIFYRLDGLFHLFDADAQVPYFPFLSQPVKLTEYFRPVINLCRRTMELYEVKALSADSFQRGFHVTPEHGRGISLADMRCYLPPAFCCNTYFASCFPDYPADCLFTLTVRIDVGGINEIDSPLYCLPDYCVSQCIIKFV